MYLNVDSPEGFANTIANLDRGQNDHWLIMLADHHQDQLADIVSALNDKGVLFLGAVVPGLIQGRYRYSTGAVIKPLPHIGLPAVIKLDTDASRWFDELPSPDEIGSRKPTLYLFVDCLSPAVSSLLSAVFNRFGNLVNYFGGGTGNHMLSDKPSVFSPQGLFSNAALAVIGDVQGRTNVRHGWQRVEGPFVATRTRGNIIEELNWEPAEDVYRRALPAKLRDTPAEDFFSKVTPNYPFSIQKEGAEDIVRDPVRLTEDGTLVCVSDVPSNSVMYLVHGDRQQLVEAAGQAIEEITANLPAVPNGCMVCDCFSRKVLFGNDFEQELGVVADKLAAAASSLEAEGALVLGEIASEGEQSLEFFNKTFVVSITYG